MCISNKAIDPEIGASDLDSVAPLFKRACHVDAERPLPCDAERLAVDLNFGEVGNVAEVEPELGSGLEPFGGGVDGSGVGGVTGEVLNTGVVTLAE